MIQERGIWTSNRFRFSHSTSEAGITHVFSSDIIYPTADTYIYEASSTANFSSSTTFNVGDNGIGKSRAILQFNFPSLVGRHIETATLKLKIFSDNSLNSRNFQVFRIIKPVAVSITHWIWYDTSLSWTTSGAGSNGNDVDYSAVIASESFSDSEAVGTVKSFILDPAIIQGFVDGVYNNRGLLIKSDVEASDLYTFHSVNAVSVGDRPVIEYTYH